MDFHILGPVEVHLGGGPVRLGRRQERLLLGLLLFEAGRRVSLARLAQLIWPEAPPGSGRTPLYTYLARLRTVLRDHDVQVTTTANGYCIDVEPGRVDLFQFQALVRQAGALDDPLERAAVLTRALALWRGPLLADVADDELRRRVAGEPDRWRHSAEEQLAEAWLASGQPDRVVAELMAKVSREPTRERLAAQLMTGLYRTGRQVEALEVYRDIRQRLVDDFGIEPGPLLRELHERMLRHDPPLNPPARAGAGGPGPAHLPLDLPTFSARAVELAWLDDALRRAESHPTAAGVCVVTGAPGIGKTTLAVHWAHLVAPCFPDGQLYIDLHGHDDRVCAVDPLTVLPSVIEALGGPRDPQRATRSPDELVASFRSLLVGRRVLIVLDDVQDAEQALPFLPGAPGSMVVVTSRTPLEPLIAATGASCLSVPGLTPAEARELLDSRWGPNRSAAEPAAVEAIVARCDGLPLTLAVVAARAVAERQLPLAELVEELTVRTSSPIPRGEPISGIRGALDLSYGGLTPAAGLILRRLSHHPGPDASGAAIASMTGLPLPTVELGLSELVDAHLLTEPATGRFVVHDLVRSFAEALPDPQVVAARRQLVEHYLHSAYNAVVALKPVRPPMTPGSPAPGVVIAPVSPIEWFVTERLNLLAVMRLAGYDEQVWQLGLLLAEFFDRTRSFTELADTQRLALAAARRVGRIDGQAFALYGLAGAMAELGNLSRARSYLAAAQRMLSTMDDSAGLVHIHLATCWVLARDGREAEALEHALAAVEQSTRDPDNASEAPASNAVAHRQLRLGRPDLALPYAERSRALHARNGNIFGEANACFNLARAHEALGEADLAADFYRRAIEGYATAGLPDVQAETLVHLGDLRDTAGDLPGAHEAWRAAADLYDRSDPSAARELRQRLPA